jgi:hypothetical protein
VGLVGFTTRGIQGAAVPCALLNTLMVHPAYRRQGLAGGLSKWCIRHARSRFGENGVILADVQVGNRASHGTVRKWCNQMLPPITVAPVGFKTRGPGVLPGIRVGPVKRPALQEFTDRLNDFYKTYTFFKYETGHDLSAWLEERPFGLHTRHCLGARDPRGNLLAGLTLDEVHHLRTYHVARMPAWIRMANKLLHVVPADGVLRQIQAGRIWFRPGQVAAARYLWQTVRRQWLGRGTCLMVFLDGRGPVASVINLKPWSIRTMMRTVVKTSIPILEDRLIYPIF